MTTWLLTPKSPDPITGLQSPIVGWHLTQATALDVLQGMGTIAALGYHHRLETVDITVIPPIYQLVINRATETATVNDTDWLVANEHTSWGISEDDVTANYDVVAKT